VPCTNKANLLDLPLIYIMSSSHQSLLNAFQHPSTDSCSRERLRAHARVQATTPGCECEALLGSESIRVPRSPRVLASSCAAPPRPQTWALDAVNHRQSSQAKLAERNKQRGKPPCHTTMSQHLCRVQKRVSKLSLTHSLTHMRRARVCVLSLSVPRVSCLYDEELVAGATPWIPRNGSSG
jgi:hypothetical protein